MDINELLRIDRIHSGDGAAKTSGSTNPKAFQNVLEELQGLAKNAAAAAPETKDVNEFSNAMRKAEDEFTALMDLRRRLEEAFRTRQP